MSENSNVAISLQNVSKSFGERKVLDDVSLEVEKGQALCVMGRSGTGKSVTLKLIIGLLKPDSGCIYIDGEDITKLDGRDLSRVRQKMGFLFQNAALLDSFNVNDNLKLILKRAWKDKSKQEIGDAIQKQLESVGLGEDRYKMPVELSGGMRKRAGLARAMILSPSILLVDEPTSALDRITASEIDDLLLKFKTEHGTAIVIVTHDVQGAKRVGDKVAILDEGKLVAYDTFDALEHNDNDVVRELISVG